MPINFEQKKDDKGQPVTVKGEALDFKEPTVQEAFDAFGAIASADKKFSQESPKYAVAVVLEKADEIGGKIEQISADATVVTKQGAIKVVEAGGKPDDLKKVDDAKLNLTTQLKRTEEEAKAALAKEVEQIHANRNLSKKEQDNDIKTARRVSKAEVKDIKNQPEPFNFSKPVTKVEAPPTIQPDPAPAPAAPENPPKTEVPPASETEKIITPPPVAQGRPMSPEVLAQKMVAEAAKRKVSKPTTPVASVVPAVPNAPTNNVDGDNMLDQVQAEVRKEKFDRISQMTSWDEVSKMVEGDLSKGKKMSPDEVTGAVSALLKEHGQTLKGLGKIFEENIKKASAKKGGNTTPPIVPVPTASVPASPDPVLDHKSPILGGNPDKNLPGYGQPKAKIETSPKNVVPEKNSLDSFEGVPDAEARKKVPVPVTPENPPQQPPQGPKTPDVPPPPGGSPRRRPERVEDTTPVEKLNWYDKFLIKKAGVNQRLEATLGGYTDSVVGKIKDWLPISRFGVAFNQFFVDHYDKKAFKVAGKVKDIEMGIAKIRGQIEADEMVSRGGKLSRDEAFSLAQRKRDAGRSIATLEGKKDRLSTKVSTLNNIRQEWIGTRRDIVAGMVEKLNDRVHPCEDQLNKLQSEKNEFDKEVGSFQTRIEARKRQLRSIEMDAALNPELLNEDGVAEKIEELKRLNTKDQNKLFEIKEDRQTLERRIVIASDLINQRKDRAVAFERLNISSFMHQHQNRAERPEPSSKDVRHVFDTPKTTFQRSDENEAVDELEVIPTPYTPKDLVDEWNWSDKDKKKENNKGLIELNADRIARILGVDVGAEITLEAFKKAVLADNEARQKMVKNTPNIKVVNQNLLAARLDAFIEKNK